MYSFYLQAFVNPLQGIFNYFIYRRAFKVTATDIRPERNALPRVTVPPSLDDYRRSRIRPSGVSTNQTLRGITASKFSIDEKSSLIRTQNETPAPQFAYFSRLLGE